tara:strand:- start:262 stop:516 length:255 start_codon:yes stop_codon:yes gene_type:complete
MSWLLDKIKSIFHAAGCGTNCDIHEQDTEETVPKPPAEPSPTNEELAAMKMPALRELAASRNLASGNYKGMDRRTITKLIKESY